MIQSDYQINWQAVIDRCPKGYVELNDGKHITYGPVDRVEINDGMVEIHVKWAADIPLDESGIPKGKWKVLSRGPALLTGFPDGTVPFVIESTLDKGERVRFGEADVLYFEDVSKIKWEEIEADAVPA
jgi:hypothetical protein